MTTLKQFEADLIKFIKNHPHTKEQNANPEVIKLPSQDKTLVTMHTVDGDYERITITINYIP